MTSPFRRAVAEFIIEAADRSKGPWYPVGEETYKLAKAAYSPARAFWERGGKTRRWVRVRRTDGQRAAHVFYGGRYKPGCFGTWERVR